MSTSAQVFQSDQASYAAIMAYLALEHIGFPGDWLLQLATLFVFFYARFERYCHASDGQKRRYAALCVGYIAFSLIPLALLTLTSQFQLRAPLPALWSSTYLDAIYIIPAVVYLAIVDRMKEPNKAPEPTTTSVMPAAEQPSRRP